MKLRLYLLTFITALLLSACGKNEFTIDFDLQDAGTQNLRFLYLASSDKEEILIDNSLPIVGGKLTLQGVTRYPTIVYIFSPTGNMLTSIYAGKGDRLTVTGKLSNPLEWKVKGNESSEAYASWLAKNAKSIQAGDAKKINSLISRYFTADHDDAVATLLLLNLYSERADEAGFRKLWTQLPADESTDRLKKAAMSSAHAADSRSAKITVPPITLLSATDSMTTINPSAHELTAIYMWHDNPDRDIMTTLIDKAESKDLKVADICMNADTMTWKQNIRHDGIDHPASYWALGGTANLGLQKLAVPRLPYLILVDRKGRQLYRGDNIDELIKSIH